MIKCAPLAVVAVAVSSTTLQAGEGCGSCKGKDKGTEKTEQST